MDLNEIGLLYLLVLVVVFGWVSGMWFYVMVLIVGLVGCLGWLLLFEGL